MDPTMSRVFREKSRLLRRELRLLAGLFYGSKKDTSHSQARSEPPSERAQEDRTAMTCNARRRRLAFPLAPRSLTEDCGTPQGTRLIRNAKRLPLACENFWPDYF